MKTDPTEKEKLIEVLEVEISNCQDDLDAASLAYEEGILISKREAVVLLDLAQSSPKIRQLEWEDTDMWYFKAKTSLGLGYSITEIKGTYIVHFGDAPISWEKSLESAKAVAQADFEKRIKECLL
jgi:hypothetical protein